MVKDGFGALLADHKISSPGDVAREMHLFGRTHFRTFLTELAQFEPSPVSQRGSLSYFAAGGRLGMGSAERASRALLLVADQIVLPYDIGHQASALLADLQKAETSKEFIKLKESAEVRLQPYLYQYLKVRPLVERGLLTFFRTTTAPISPLSVSPALNLIHPLAKSLASSFLPWVDYGLGESTKGPWMMMKVGENCYNAFQGVRSFGAHILIGKPPFSSTDDIQFLSDMRPTGKFDPRPAEELLSGSSPLSEALENFVSIELFRAETIAEAAVQAHASLATDSEDDWRLLQLLSRTSPEGMQLETAAGLAEEIAGSLPFFAGLGIRELAELREAGEAAFDSFRGMVLAEARRIAAEPDERKRRKEAKVFLIEELRPRLSQYISEVETLANSRLRSSVVAGASVATLAAMVLLVGPETLTASSAVPLLTAAKDHLSKALASQEALDRTAGEPMFFLWQAKKAASA